jgi:hypothetical protein
LKQPTAEYFCLSAVCWNNLKQIAKFSGLSQRPIHALPDSKISRLENLPTYFAYQEKPSVVPS